MFSKGLFFKVVKTRDCVVDNTIELTTKRQNFRPVQIERLCRRQNKRDSKIEFCHGMGKKYGKRTKCWSPAFSPRPTMFSKALVFKDVIM